MVKLHELLCRNDRMVVTDPFIVHKTSICADRFVQKCSCQFTIRTCTAGLESFFECRDYILADIT